MTEEREKLVSNLCDQIEELVSKIRNSNSEEYIDKVAFGIELAGKYIQRYATEEREEHERLLASLVAEGELDG
jgi:hypothetical protein